MTTSDDLDVDVPRVRIPGQADTVDEAMAQPFTAVLEELEPEPVPEPVDLPLTEYDRILVDPREIIGVSYREQREFLARRRGTELGEPRWIEDWLPLSPAALSNEKTRRERARLADPDVAAEPPTRTVSVTVTRIHFRSGQSAPVKVEFGSVADLTAWMANGYQPAE